MRRTFAFLLLLCAPALAMAQEYRIDPGFAVSGGTLKVEPTVTGPAGKALRYEMQVQREGKGRAASNSRAGTVKLDASGKAQFGYTSLSLNQGDRYRVTVRLFDGDRLVAEQSAQHP